MSMKTFGIALFALGALLAVVPAQAADANITVTSAQNGGNFVWTTAQGENPTLNVDPGANVTILMKKGADTPGVPHNVRVTGGGLNVESADVSNPGEEESVRFTAPQSGTLTYLCDYHPSMKGTITVGTATTTGEGTNGTPGASLLGVVVALVGAALVLVRRQG